ncbi:hypothetical protein DASC09_060770 [Saccharomycopsis crataegensis]|uniref:YMC020W-like alpha/beta hydrolase domain-containing protein n=1 Tax=Saccharomycopsis crataegensis TaxID=43959 RepID=A0AAV5QV60_9ASCO|nr:hypothetical protein DASC09_060770 [Saccharomycopsis crataegensis]
MSKYEDDQESFIDDSDLLNNSQLNAGEVPNNNSNGSALDDSINDSSDSVYWKTWRQKIGGSAINADKYGTATLNMTTSKSEKSIDMKLPKSRSNLSIARENSWWSWRNGEKRGNDDNKTSSQWSLAVPIDNVESENDLIMPYQMQTSVMSKQNPHSVHSSNDNKAEGASTKESGQHEEIVTKDLLDTKNKMERYKPTLESATEGGNDEVPIDSSSNLLNQTRTETQEMSISESKWYSLFSATNDVNLQPTPKASLPSEPQDGKDYKYDINKQENGGWWNSNWIWNSISQAQSPTDLVSEDGDHHESIDSKKARKVIKSFDVNTPSYWAFISHDPNLIIGELAIGETEFEDNPIMMFNELPKSKMEQAMIDKKTTANNRNNEKIMRKDSCESEDIFDRNESQQNVFPTFKECYRPLEVKTRIRLIARKLLRNIKIAEMSIPIERHLYHDSKLTHKDHKNNSSELDLQKKLLVVNIQNFLPLELLKYVDDKSVYSVDSSKAIINLARRWGQSKGFDTDTLEIELLTLRGKNLVTDQVENFFEIIIKNWIMKFSECDYLLFVGNFNSGPIAVHILSKCFKKYKKIFADISKIGIISINGIWSGPLITNNEKKSRDKNDTSTRKSKRSRSNDSNVDAGNVTIESTYSVKKEIEHLDKKIANEMFQYADPDSEYSYWLDYDIRHLLSQSNVKISFIGSMNAKLVPLYSSLCCQFSHPNINRLVYMNNKGKLFSKFVVNLVKVCVTVKNLGYDDYNMLVYLSDYLIRNSMNPMISSSSKPNLLHEDCASIYQHEETFQSALQFCLETTNLVLNDISGMDISGQHIQVDDESQIQEGQFLRHGSLSETNKDTIKSAFRHKNYYINNSQDVMKFSKVNYPELINNFNDFQYPWILNKLIKELQVIKHIDVVSLIEDLRVSVQEWTPKDQTSQKLKSSLEVIAISDYL